MASAVPPFVRLLGDLTIERDGKLQTLPPSKKARAVLAYLILSEKEHRRERLSSLLWDVADDPRASLRWVLTRIRPLVDGGETKRIAANRETVRFEVQGARVDALEIRRALNTDTSAVSTEELKKLALLFRGELLEGLDLHEFMSFQSWLMAEREEMRRLHISLLSELIKRHDHDDGQALVYGRKLVDIDPFDAEARAELTRRLARLGRTGEARETVRAGKRLFQELGDPCPSVLLEALGSAGKRRATTAPPPPTSEARRESIESAPLSVRRTPPLPIVGRDALVLTLNAHLTGTKHTPLLLLGEPGVGKSRLIVELERLAVEAGFNLLGARAHEAEIGRPYGPWLDALRRFKSRSGSEGIVSRLLQDLSGLAAEESSRDALFAGVSALLQAESKHSPLCLFLDDLHWCDEASVGLLNYVLRTCSREAVQLVMASRDGELIDNAAFFKLISQLRRERQLLEFPLSRLSEEDTERLVQVARASLPLSSEPENPEDVRSIYEKSAGNPLFALEIARNSGASSESLKGVVAERLSRLTPDTLDLIRWASVHGAKVSLRKLQAQLPLSAEALMNALEELERFAILIPEGEDYAFTHDIVRNVVYGELSAPRRKLMHQRIAESLRPLANEDPTITDELVHHAVIAGEGRLAAEACLASGRRCLRIFANHQAEVSARTGLHHSQELEDGVRVPLTLELLEVSFSARRPQEPTALDEQLSQLAEQALDLGLMKHSRLAFTMLAYLRWEQGNWSGAKATTMSAEFVSRAEDGPARVEAMAEAGRCLAILEKDLSDAESLLLEANALAERLGIDSAPLSDGKGLLRLHQGELGEAAQHFERAALLAQRDGIRILEFYARAHAAMLEIERACYSEAERHLGPLERLAQKLRGGSELPFTCAMLCFCAYAKGNAEARDQLLSHLEELRVVDAKYRLVFILGRLAEFDRKEARFEEARVEASNALGLATTLGRPSEQALARITLAEIALQEGRLTEAQTEIQEIDRLMPEVSLTIRQRALLLRKRCVPSP